MTNPTPISTASSSDDLVEQFRKDVEADAFEQIKIMCGAPSRSIDETASRIAVLAVAHAKPLRLRQPVAGDVVERKISHDYKLNLARSINDILCELHDAGIKESREMASKMSTDPRILKLIGGGK